MSPRGGPRKGSGRPRLQDARVPVTIRVRPETANLIRGNRGGYLKARDLLDRWAKMNAPKVSDDPRVNEWFAMHTPDEIMETFGIHRRVYASMLHAQTEEDCIEYGSHHFFKQSRMNERMDETGRIRGHIITTAHLNNWCRLEWRKANPEPPTPSPSATRTESEPDP